MVVRDLARGLAAAGHQPMVYSPILGEVANEIASGGVPVCARLDQLPAAPEVIHGHHHVETVEALQAFPGAPGIFVCHGRVSWFDVPPRHPRIFAFVAVDRNCLERLADVHRIDGRQLRTILNSVDTDRFKPRSALPAKPGRAAVFSTAATINSHEAVEEACRNLDIRLDYLGPNAGNPCNAPEHALADYDLVFAKARCALEAMAVGCAVIVADTRGLGGLVTPRNFEHFRQWNFGMRLQTRLLERDPIAAEIGHYDAVDVASVRDRVQTEAGLVGAVEQYVRLYGEAVEWGTTKAFGAIRHSFSDSLRSLAQTAAAFELGAAAGQPVATMGILPAEEARGVQVFLDSVPAEALPSAEFITRVSLRNGSSVPLGTFAPYPVNLCYHWYEAAAPDRVVVFDGRRTPLFPALAPGEKRSYRMLVNAPDFAGRFRLRLTLVQEGVRWFDGLGGASYADAEVSVPAPK